MGKPTAKKKDHNHQNQELQRPGNAHPKPNSKPSERASSKASFDEDTAMFIAMSQEFKEEGNKLFQKRDNEGAILKYEKALKLLPKTHIDVAHLHSSMASCYMQMGLGEYPRAIRECGLALEVSPRFSKALLKRAKCYEALNRLDFALRDVRAVLAVEPNNISALEISEGLRKSMAEKGIVVDENEILGSVAENVEIPSAASHVKKKNKKKTCEKRSAEEKVKEKVKVVLSEESNDNDGKPVSVKDQEVIPKTFVKDKSKTKGKAKTRKKSVIKVENQGLKKTVKLVFGDDIRWGRLPANVSMKSVRNIVKDRFPGLKGVLLKYRDQEGDLVTITTVHEMKLAESTSDPQGSFKLYISETSLDQEPVYEGASDGEEDPPNGSQRSSEAMENGGSETERGSLTCIEDWILQFARLFKNHVGFDSDSCLDLHELGTKLHSEAMEDSLTGEDAQELFDMASEKFQEMSAVALFNWGNVHMSKARKRVSYPEDALRDQILEKIGAAYEWSKKEYAKAEKRYEESLRLKPDFYEGYLAKGQQQFEQAKLCWYYSVGTRTESEAGASSEVIQLYNKAEDSMEKGMLMWEELEEQRLNGISKGEKHKSQLQKMGLGHLFKELSGEEAAERASNMAAQIYLLWGTLLYERSVVEYKLGLPTWEECLEVAVEKFELAGASPTDIAVMVKNHCSNETALEGLGFKIDEIVQAWNEMYDAQRWQFGAPSFRLEPLFRRRVPKLHSMFQDLF